jgi:hypothetical protein
MQNVSDKILTALIIIFILSILAAFRHGRAWEKKFTNKLGFKWGYFILYNTTISSASLFCLVVWIGIIDLDPEAFIIGLLGLLIIGTVAVFGFLRRKWALVATTIFSLNPLWILINYFYLRNRWEEFEEELEQDGRLTPQKFFKNLKNYRKDTKIFILFSIGWVLCVPIYVLLFSPYGGSMNDNEIFHMMGVISLPIGTGIGLFWIYRKLF